MREKSSLNEYRIESKLLPVLLFSLRTFTSLTCISLFSFLSLSVLQCFPSVFLSFSLLLFPSSICITVLSFICVFPTPLSFFAHISSPSTLSKEHRGEGLKAKVQMEIQKAEKAFHCM